MSAEPIARVMLALQREGRTGVLDVRGDGVRAVVYLAEGVPVYAEHGVMGDALGRILVHQGRLRDEDYVGIIEKMTAGDKRRFGEIATAMRLLSQEDVWQALAAQVRAKVQRCLVWIGATWTFDPSIERVKAVVRFPTRVEPLVYAAMRELDAAQLDAILASARGTFPALVGYVDAVKDRFQLGASAAKFLRSVNGVRSLEELFASAASLDDARPIIAALVVAGELTLEPSPRILSIAPPPPTEPPRRHAALPGLRRALPTAVAGAGGARKAHARAIVNRLAASRAAASVPPPPAPSRRPAFPRIAGLFAEQAFIVGRAHMRANRFARALPELRRASELAPNVREYALYVAWVELRTAAGDAAALAPLRARLERLARDALRQEPSLVLAHSALGHVARVAGDRGAAERHFAHARRASPEAFEAERHVRVVARSRTARPKLPRLTGVAKGSAFTPPAKPTMLQGPALGPKGTLVMRPAEAHRTDATPPLSPSADALRDDGAGLALQPTNAPNFYTPARLSPLTPPPALFAPAPPALAPLGPPPAPAPLPPAWFDAPAPLPSSPSALVDAPARISPLAPPPALFDAPTQLPPPPPPPPPPSVLVDALAPLSSPPPPPARLDAPAPVRAEGPAFDVPSWGDAPRSQRSAHVSATVTLPLGADAGAPSAVLGVAPPDVSSSPRRQRGRGVILALVLVAAVVGLVVVARAVVPRAPRPSAVRPSAVPTSMPVAASTATTSAPRPSSSAPALSRAPAPAPTSSASAPPALAPSASQAAPSPSIGRIVPPPSAKFHRIFVDGRYVSEGTNPVDVRCGAHTVKIGSAGKPQPIDVPCGADVDVPE